MINLIVFDFDGTLVDTWKVVERAIKKSVGKFGYKVSREFLDVLGNWSIEETLERFLDKNKHIREIVLDFVEKKEENFEKVKAVKNLDAIRKIKQKKIILSNNVSSFIRKVLSNLKVDFFDEVYGADKFKSKEDKFRKIIKKDRLKPSEVVYVGDKPVDVLLARDIGCICVAISQKASWSSRKELLDANPDFLINDLKELEKIVKLDSGCNPF